MIKKLLCVVSIIFILGCGHDTVRTVFIEPPDELLEDVDVAAPPNIEEYLNFTPDQKEDVLIKLNRKQLENVDTANVRFKNIRVWKQQKKDLIEKSDQTK